MRGASELRPATVPEYSIPGPLVSLNAFAPRVIGAPPSDIDFIVAPVVESNTRASVDGYIAPATAVITAPAPIVVLVQRQQLSLSLSLLSVSQKERRGCEDEVPMVR